MKNSFWAFALSTGLLFSCGTEEKSDKKKEATEPAFCDCVNKDYHHDGDKEKCEEIEKELTRRLESASQEEKGDILMKIQDCKVQGQYDND